MDKEGKTLTVLTYYTDKDGAPEKTVSVDFGRRGEYEIYLLDEEKNGEKLEITENLVFTMKPNTCIMIKEV